MALISQKRSSGPFKKLFTLVVVVGIAVGGFMLYRQIHLPPPASVDVTSDLPAIGKKTTFTVKATEPVKGIESVTAAVNGVPVELAGDASGPNGATFVVGKEAMKDLKPGKALVTVTVQAKGTKLRKPAPVVVEKPYDVRFTPPSLAATSQFIHPTQGGAEVVVYEVSQTAVKDGVQAGDWFFPGHVLPGGTGPTQHFALFAIPYEWDGVDEAQIKEKVLLIAEDDIGNRAEQPFIQNYTMRSMGKDTIQLHDPFLKKVTGEIFARTPELQKKDVLIDDYLTLNNGLRKKNMQELLELSKKSQEKFLWSTTFQPFPNGAVKGSFADRRTYVYEGKDVDTEDHLGFDLASVEHTPVPASNSGVVAQARYFGIFGNCVVIDHGYGLMTLYAHLSQIEVKPGEAVKAGQEIGRTGATGLAGGDHLHFTVLVDGLPVHPAEWWDAHWIHDRLKLKLGDSLPWTG